jgi:hypothetical protein
MKEAGFGPPFVDTLVLQGWATPGGAMRNPRRTSDALWVAGLVSACLFSGFAFSGDAPNTTRSAPEVPANEPMPTKMAKPGLKQGDVRKSAERQKRRMQPALEKEERSMAKPR